MAKSRQWVVDTRINTHCFQSSQTSRVGELTADVLLSMVEVSSLEAEALSEKHQTPDGRREAVQ